MNSGTTNTDLNDMLINFTDYVNDFYGNSDDVLYPMNHEKTGKRVTKTDILSAIYDYLHLINTVKNDDQYIIKYFFFIYCTVSRDSKYQYSTVTVINAGYTCMEIA